MLSNGTKAYIKGVLDETLERYAPEEKPTIKKFNPTKITYKGRILSIKGKAAWKMPGHAKLALRNAIDHYVKAKMFERHTTHTVDGEYYYTFRPTGEVVTAYQISELVDEIFEFIYQEVVRFEPI